MSAQKSSRADLQEKKITALIQVVQRLLDENGQLKLNKLKLITG